MRAEASESEGRSTVSGIGIAAFSGLSSYEATETAYD